MKDAEGKEIVQGQQQNSNTPPPDQQPPASTMVPVATLQEERRKRQEAEERANLAEMKAAGKTAVNQGNENQDDPAVPDFKIEESDVYDPKKLSEKLTVHTKAIYEAAVKTVRKELSRNENKAQVDKVIAKYPIFADEDKALANSAARELAERIKSDPSKNLEQHTADVAKQFSRYKVADANARAAAGNPPAANTPAPLPSGNTGAEVAHMEQQKPAITNFHDASAAALKILQSEEGRRNAAGQQI
ncbi:MAG TPA: hypothetical protein DCZ94_21600 [Lentisphaeria bacterium]|nr:MAG: hypothetical protein A2X48_14530 [Lentisphaerae bacterium GWF2_49_21]HBC89541.1 hypothetical protein [Lentisphaeria bacterium]